jgi:hypothetical protein
MTPMIRFYGLSVQNRPAAIGLAVIALAVGATLLAFGLVLLAAAAAVGTLVGTGILAYRALTGQRPSRLHHPESGHGLDPTLQVFPPRDPPDQLTS